MRHGQGDELWFAGRKMDLIIRGGANISPVEIEAVLKSRTAVRAAAVFGIPDSALGQRVANHRLAGFINPEVISHIGLEAMTTSGPTWEFLVHAIEACEGWTSSGNSVAHPSRLRPGDTIGRAGTPRDDLVVELTVPDGWPIHVTWAAISLDHVIERWRG
jgi:hypothetical protein